MEDIFEIKSNLAWLNTIPSRIQTIYLDKLLYNGTISEVHNDFKKVLFKRVLQKSEHVGIWGWNSWCGIHTLPLLTKGSISSVLKKTIDAGFKNLESESGLLPHAILHKNGVFCSEPTFRCNYGKNGEAYNLDNILCWAKMAMEYFLISNDRDWFTEEKMKTITHSIDYILNNFRAKYNPYLIYTGKEGDWTECTDWELDNANVNVNMLRTLRLAMECQILMGKSYTKMKYEEIFHNMLNNFNKPYTEGGFWHPELGHYIHGNNGDGTIIHGDQYFESTANYFALLWGFVPKLYKLTLWGYILIHQAEIEKPYPVLTNFNPRTGARRNDYGNTVTNGDVWFVLGAHAAAARLQEDYIYEATNMFKTIEEYEGEHGVIHNCIYPKTGRVNDSWDPEVANYGSYYAIIVLGVLGLNAQADGLHFNLKALTGLKELHTRIFIYGREIEFHIHFDQEKVESVKIIEPENPLYALIEFTINTGRFLILRTHKLEVIPE